MNYVSYVRLRAQEQPHAVAVRHGDDSWTYAELLTDIRRTANVLANHCVDQGSVCALVLENRYEFVVGTLAGLARQALVAPINAGYGPRELDGILTKIDPDVVIGASDSYDAAGEALSGGTAWLDVDGATDDQRTDFWETVTEASDDYRIPQTLGSERGFLLFTSGTTGQPKGAVHTHGTFIAVSDACAISYEMSPGDTFLAAMPMCHCTGMSVVGTTLKVGGELAIVSEWDSEATLEAIAEYDVNVFSGVPTMFQDWLQIADGSEDTSSMHTGVIGGAGTSADLIRRSESLLGCPVLNGYGMTETFIAGVWEDRRDERRFPSVGRIDDRLVEVKVIDPETGDAARTGELLLRGRPVMEGYYREPEKTAAAFDDGWFHTGDLVELDADGYLYFLDRMDATILCGGHNVYPQEVEASIEELDGVERAVVIGREDERKGEKPVAFVERSTTAVTEARIKSHCLNTMAAYKHPRSVTFVDDLPLNDVGKVDREALAERTEIVKNRDS